VTERPTAQSHDRYATLLEIMISVFDCPYF
jgi:hypothetical protein